MRRLLLALLLFTCGIAEAQAPHSVVRGFPNSDREDRTEFNQASVVEALTERSALDVACHAAGRLVASDTAETGSTTTVINATSHSAIEGDVIVFTSGALVGQQFTVWAVSANAITLGQTAGSAPSNGDGFDILRYNALRVDSSGGLRIGTVSGTVTVDTELAEGQAAADNTSNPTVPGVRSFGHVWDGSTWDRAPGTSADGTLVNLGANNDVTVTSGTVTIQDGGNVISVDDGAGVLSVDDAGSTLSVDDGAGSLTVDGTVTVTDGSGALNVIVDSGTTAVTQATASSLNAQVVGLAAHDAAASGNPVAIGGRTQSTEQTAVTAADVSYFFMDLLGRLINKPYAVSQLDWTTYTSGSSSGDSTLLAADATYKLCITQIEVTKNDALTASTFSITSGASGVGLYQTVRAASNHFPINVTFPSPICTTAVNTALIFNSSAAVNWAVSASGFRTKN